MILGKILFRAVFVLPAMILLFSVILKLLGFEDRAAFNIGSGIAVIILVIINFQEAKKNEK